jgi:hypothetical protein
MTAPERSKLFTTAITQAGNIVRNETQEYNLENNLETLFGEVTSYVLNYRRLDISPTVSFAERPDMKMDVRITPHSEPESVFVYDSYILELQIVPTEQLGGITELTPKTHYRIQKNMISETSEQRKDIFSGKSAVITKRYIEQIRYLLHVLDSGGAISKNNPFSSLIAQAEKEFKKTIPQRRRGRELAKLVSIKDTFLQQHKHELPAPNEVWNTYVEHPNNPTMNMRIFLSDGGISISFIPKEDAIQKRIKRNYEKSILFDHDYFFSEDYILADNEPVELTSRKADQYIKLFGELIEMARKGKNLEH